MSTESVEWAEGMQPLPPDTPIPRPADSNKPTGWGWTQEANEAFVRFHDKQYKPIRFDVTKDEAFQDLAAKIEAEKKALLAQAWSEGWVACEDYRDAWVLPEFPTNPYGADS